MSASVGDFPPPLAAGNEMLAFQHLFSSDCISYVSYARWRRESNDISGMLHWQQRIEQASMSIRVIKLRLLYSRQCLCGLSLEIG